MSVLPMATSTIRCALSACRGQPSFPSTSGVSTSEGPSESQWRRRASMTKHIGLRPGGSRQFLQQKTSSVQLPQTFVPQKPVFTSQASNSRVIAAKQIASTDKNGNEPHKVEKQAKSRTTSPGTSSEGVATTRQVVVKDGFAGLSGLKAQLERERPRLSRVKLNDVGGEFLAQQKKQAEIRRSRQAVGTSPSSSKVDVKTNRGTSSSKSTSSDGPTTLIVVTNLAKQVTEEDYQLVMQSIPEVSSWKYLSDMEGQCLGYGFCEVQAESDVEAIIEHLSQQVFYGKKVKASLSERSGEYSKQSLERHSKPAATTSRGQKQGNPGVRKQAGLRDVWKPSSMEIDTTEMRRAEDSSQDFRTDRKLSDKFTNRKPEMEAGQDFTPSSIERDTLEMGSSSTGVGSSQGLDSTSASKLSGKSVLEALQRAAVLRDSRAKSRRRKGRSGGGKYGSDSDSDDDSKQDPLPPLVFRPEWASRIEELENDLKQLRLLS